MFVIARFLIVKKRLSVRQSSVIIRGISKVVVGAVILNARQPSCRYKTTINPVDCLIESLRVISFVCRSIREYTMRVNSGREPATELSDQSSLTSTLISC